MRAGAAAATRARRCRSRDLPINWDLPGRPTLGAGAKHVDRDYFNHSMAVAVAMVMHDMPQHDNRVDLDPSVVDAWSLSSRESR